ncbi:MAG: 1-deoxy-D-xylulose-5-phosphate synthase, partial [Planctomycetes bacterium]|nr:1-deoxy-D-xylulose-5-phosphate synthase [Planctomycetota bacterium]
VLFAIDRAGLVGEDGISHHGLFDIAYLRTFPRMVLMAPKDGEELKQMLAFSLEVDHPTAVRFARGSAPARLPGLDGSCSSPIELGKMEILRHGTDGSILAYGHMVQTALDTADLLAAKGLEVEVVNGRFAKPLDEQGILALADRHDRIMTLEDHSVLGGFGSAVLELCAAKGPVRARIDVAGVADEFVEHGSRAELLRQVGLDAESLAARFLSRRPASVF